MHHGSANFYFTFILSKQSRWIEKIFTIGRYGRHGASFIPSSLLSGFAEINLSPEPANIAVQLYSVRKELEKDMKGTLKRIADIGFETVETAFWPKDVSVKQAGQFLRMQDCQYVQRILNCRKEIRKQHSLKRPKSWGVKK